MKDKSGSQAHRGLNLDCANGCPPHSCPADHMASLLSSPLPSAENPKHSAGGCLGLLQLSSLAFPCCPLWTPGNGFQCCKEGASSHFQAFGPAPTSSSLVLNSSYFFRLEFGHYSPPKVSLGPPKPLAVLTAPRGPPVQCLLCCVGSGPLPPGALKAGTSSDHVQARPSLHTVGAG